jgi:organic hydroperoxide reductase OsmC/OhrA
MLKLPIEFFSKAVSMESHLKPWTIVSGDQSGVCSVPVEFGGPGGGFSPEDLYLQALINCFVGTFKVYAQGSKIEYAKLEVFGTLLVNQNSVRKTTMEKCQLKVDLFGVNRPDRVQALVEKVFRDGFILNSVKTEISHQLTLHE